VSYEGMFREKQLEFGTFNKNKHFLDIKCLKKLKNSTNLNKTKWLTCQDASL
jgi:hypothetical protein